MSSLFKFTVTIPRTDGVTKADAKRYIIDALESHYGQWTGYQYQMGELHPFEEIGNVVEEIKVTELRKSNQRRTKHG